MISTFCTKVTTDFDELCSKDSSSEEILLLQFQTLPYIYNRLAFVDDKKLSLTRKMAWKIVSMIV